jgi:hypothetical protein
MTRACVYVYISSNEDLRIEEDIYFKLIFQNVLKTCLNFYSQSVFLPCLNGNKNERI